MSILLGILGGQITAPLQQFLYVSDTFSQIIVKAPFTVTSTTQTASPVTTFAGTLGTGSFSGDNGAATSAQLNNPVGLALDSSGNLYIADGSNNRIRRVDTNGVITTIAGNGAGSSSGDGGLAINATLNFPWALAIDTNNNLYVAEYQGHRIRKINLSNNIITGFAGTGFSSFGGDNGQALDAFLNAPTGIVLDSSGRLYIADAQNHRIRRVETNGVITTIAGNGSAESSGDGGLATNASLNFPWGLAIDNNNNLYVSEYNAHVVRKIHLPSNIISTFAGTVNDMGPSGDGGWASSAKLAYPADLKIDANNNLFISEAVGNRVRVVYQSGPDTFINTVMTVLNGPYGIAIGNS